MPEIYSPKFVDVTEMGSTVKREVLAECSLSKLSAFTSGAEVPQSGLAQYTRTFSGTRRPHSIGQHLVCGDLTISIATGPTGCRLTICDEDDLSLQAECDDLEMAIGIISELENEITLDWINSYEFRY